MGVEHEALGHLFAQRLFHLQRSLARGKARAVADPEQMRVDRDCGLLEVDIEHHIGGLPAHARQRLQGRAIGRHFAIMLIEQDLRQSEDIFGLPR